MTQADPIILGNAPSSGSTLLTSIIGESPSIFQTDELYIFDKPDWVAGKASDLKEKWLRYAARGYDAHFAHESPLVFPTFGQHPDFSRYNGNYASFCCSRMDELAREANCRRWVEKTPTNIFALVHLHNALPSARFIIITRHPAMMLKSLRKRGFDPFSAAARWYFPNLIAASVIDNHQFLVVRYENLLNDPLSVCKEVFDFIGEEFRVEFLTTRGRSSGKIASWNNDPSGAIRPEKNFVELVEPWAAKEMSDLKANPHFLSYCGITSSLSVTDLAKTLGYDVDFDFRGTSAFRSSLIRRKAFLKYAAKAVRAGRKIRPFWYC